MHWLCVCVWEEFKEFLEEKEIALKKRKRIDYLSYRILIPGFGFLGNSSAPHLKNVSIKVADSKTTKIAFVCHPRMKFPTST